jgi:hypothetical protein
MDLFYTHIDLFKGNKFSDPIWWILKILGTKNAIFARNYTKNSGKRIC